MSLIQITFALFGAALAQQCSQSQYYGNISEPSSYLPIGSIQQQLTQNFTIPGSGVYSTIIVYPKYAGYNISQIDDQTYIVNSTLNLTFTFATNFDALGQALLLQTVIGTTLTFETGFLWTQQGQLNYSSPSSMQWIGFSSFQGSYSSLASQFNQYVIPYLASYYPSLTLNYSAMPQTFLYTYTNIQGEQQNTNLNVSTTSMNYSNGCIMTTVFYVIGFDDNNCSSLPQMPVQSLPQFEVVQIGAIYSMFDYAQASGYFDTILNSKWNSPYFSFLVGSAQNVLTGLAGVYPANTPITGTCENQNSTLMISNNQGNEFQVQLQELCTLNSLIPNDTTPLIQVQLTIQLTIQIKENSTGYLYFYSVDPAIKQLQFIAGSSDVIQSQTSLANLYVQSVVSKGFNHTNVYGSGFLTIPRQNPVLQINTTGLVMYDQPPQQGFKLD